MGLVGWLARSLRSEPPAPTVEPETTEQDGGVATAVADLPVPVGAVEASPMLVDLPKLEPPTPIDPPARKRTRGIGPASETVLVLEPWCRAFVRAAATDRSRYTLNGVGVFGEVLAATNGRILAIRSCALVADDGTVRREKLPLSPDFIEKCGTGGAYARDWRAPSHIVPREVFEKLPRKLSAGSSHIQLRFEKPGSGEAGPWWAVVEEKPYGFSQRYRCLEGQFPEVWDLLAGIVRRKGHATKAVAFDPDLFADLAAALGGNDLKEQQALACHFDGAKAGILVRGGETQAHAVGVLMPITLAATKYAAMDDEPEAGAETPGPTAPPAT